MRTPDVEVNVVVRLECLAEEKLSGRAEPVRHRLEWGMRWDVPARGGRVMQVPRPGWVVSQRYSTRDRRGAVIYPWVDLFDVLVGGKEFARGFVMPWIYGRADQVVTRGGSDLIEPWQYTQGLTREERYGEKKAFAVIGDVEATTNGGVVL